MVAELGVFKQLVTAGRNVPCWTHSLLQTSQGEHRAESRPPAPGKGKAFSFLNKTCT